eukprot:4836862-Alexandrium_andersonii.AAC.1
MRRQPHVVLGPVKEIVASRPPGEITRHLAVLQPGHLAHQRGARKGGALPDRLLQGVEEMPLHTAE